MPGICLLCDLYNKIKYESQDIRNALVSLLHTDIYHEEVLVDEDSVYIGVTRYDNYPLIFINKEKYSVVFEGKIYNCKQSAINEEIEELTDIVLKSPQDRITQSIKEWLLRVDGEFVIAVVDKQQNRILIFNDALGRLPLYCKLSNSGICLSRELRFITNLEKGIEFDRMAIAQYLLLGYPLSNRTLLSNIDRLSPATLIYIDLHKKELNIINVITYSFDDKTDENYSLKENADHLCKLFLKAIGDRGNSFNNNVVSLSGGFDSRAVAAGLSKLNIPFSAVTYLDYQKNSAADVAIAEEIANVLKTPWRLIQLDQPTKSDDMELLRIKSGLNYLAMSFILPFFRQIKEILGDDVVYYTGDGGDKVLPNLSPKSHISNEHKLVNYILANNQIFTLDEVVTLTGLSKQDILDEILDLLKLYPEQNLNNKYIHFYIFERGYKWLFEGEDRNRAYFWSVTPFYSLPLFLYSMNIDDKFKKRYRLYGEFLTRISTEVSGIKHSELIFPINSYFGMLFIEQGRSLYTKLPVKLKNLIRYSHSKYIAKSTSQVHIVDNSRYTDIIADQITNHTLLAEYFPLDRIKQIGVINKMKYYNLNTITSTILDQAGEL